MSIHVLGEFYLESTLDILCPICEKAKLKYNTEIIQIPYFNQAMSTTLFCENCNYRYSDILILDQKKPMEHKFEINSIDDMSVRVIRSATATVELPEFGIKIEPAAASEGYVSNIEGVLVRMRDAIKTAIKFIDDNDKKDLGTDMIQKLEKLRSGNGVATIIIKDPMGNSSIISEKTKSRELAPEEIEKLETGINIIDLSKEKTKILE